MTLPMANQTDTNFAIGRDFVTQPAFEEDHVARLGWIRDVRAVGRLRVRQSRGRGLCSDGPEVCRSAQRRPVWKAPCAMGRGPFGKEFAGCPGEPVLPDPLARDPELDASLRTTLPGAGFAFFAGLWRPTPRLRLSATSR